MNYKPKIRTPEIRFLRFARRGFALFHNTDFRTFTATHGTPRKVILLFAQAQISYLKIARLQFVPWDSHTSRYLHYYIPKFAQILIAENHTLIFARHPAPYSRRPLPRCFSHTIFCSPRFSHIFWKIFKEIDIRIPRVSMPLPITAFRTHRLRCDTLPEIRMYASGLTVLCKSQYRLHTCCANVNIHTPQCTQWRHS